MLSRVLVRADLRQGAEMQEFAAKGWRRVADPAIAAWAQAALGPARRAVAAGQDWRCGQTWLVGLDALPNDETGAVAGVALPWAVLGLAPAALHRAQLSTTRAGYPQPWTGETEAAFGFRLRRDAAHLDGLLPVGPDRARMIVEPHAWILGLPLTQADAGAAPLVVYQGSHIVMRHALAAALAPHDPSDWGRVDVTAAYQAARKVVFDTCPRVELPGEPGQAVILHRHLLHGVAPWAAGAQADLDGRIIAYFRPEFASVADWMNRP